MNLQPTTHIRFIRLFAALLIVLVSFAQVFNTQNASAGQITARSLTLVAGVTDGGSKAGGTVKHSFTFTLPSTGNVGSIKFEYCTLAAGTAGACTMPTGLVTTSATLTAQSGATGFTMINTTNGAPYITRTAASITGPLVVNYDLGAIVNPTTINSTFYVRIFSYISTNATGGSTDAGVVAASTAEPIILSGQMPESLVFCTGGTVVTTLGVPDCATATSGVISFNQLFSPTDTATSSSQMAASTNAGFGYSITVNGLTLTSGANTIPAMASSTTGVHGIGQFGLNLRANTTATSTIAVGADVAPAANGTNYRGQPVPTSGYETIDNFKFVTGDGVANSSNGGAGGTDAQIFTVSYIANVPGSQPAGTYSTTLTYICTPTF